MVRVVSSLLFLALLRRGVHCKGPTAFCMAGRGVRHGGGGGQGNVSRRGCVIPADMTQRTMGDWSPIGSFKGWRKPGLVPPGVEASGLPEEGVETLDALCGHFRIFQLVNYAPRSTPSHSIGTHDPERSAPSTSVPDGGNKYTTDDVLAAWYGTSWCPSAGKVLDLGSGVGSVGLMSAWRLRGARFVSVEAQDVSARLARKSVKFNGLEGRYDVRVGDLRDPNVLGDEEFFDLITGTPPYFPANGIGEESPNYHPQKQACRFEMRGSVLDYCQTAARHLMPGGLFVLAFPISPAFQKERLFAGARDADLTAVRFREVVFKEGDEPLLGLLALSRKVDLPPNYEMWTDTPLTIRRSDGSLHPEYATLKLAMGMQPR